MGDLEERLRRVVERAVKRHGKLRGRVHRFHVDSVVVSEDYIKVRLLYAVRFYIVWDALAESLKWQVPEIERAINRKLSTDELSALYAVASRVVLSEINSEYAVYARLDASVSLEDKPPFHSGVLDVHVEPLECAVESAGDLCVVGSVVEITLRGVPLEALSESAKEVEKCVALAVRLLRDLVKL